MWSGLTLGGADSIEEHARLLDYTRELERRVAELQRHAWPNTGSQMPDMQAASAPYSLAAELSTNVALLSMNATAEPLFIGATSGLSLSKVVGGILSTTTVVASATESGQSSNISPNSSAIERHQTERDAQRDDSQLERKLVDIYFDRIHSRYPFIDKPCFYAFLDQYQHVILNSETDQAKLFQLHMVLAISARMTQLHLEMEKVCPDFYYSKAIRHMDRALQTPGLQRIQCLLLLVVYVLRSPHSISNLGSWHIVGVAIRYAVELGLHRKIKSSDLSPEDCYRIQLRRRVFWSAYVLDRAISLTLGRPFALSEGDIDVDVSNCTTLLQYLL
jgi:hypothetical protein